MHVLYVCLLVRRLLFLHVVTDLKSSFFASKRPHSSTPRQGSNTYMVIVHAWIVTFSVTFYSATPLCIAEDHFTVVSDVLT